MGEKLSHEAFVKRAIISPRKERYKGIHSVYPWFNEASEKFFSDEDPVAVANELSAGGKIVIRPVKGGVMSYRPEGAPGSGSAEQALKKMGLG